MRFVAVLLLIFFLPLQAQQVLKGVVVEKESGQPIPSASVTVSKAGEQQLLTFARTDDKGAFELQLTQGQLSQGQQTGLILTVRSLGRKAYTHTLTPTDLQRAVSLKIPLESSDIALREVTIKGAPVRVKPDTITYDLGEFASEKDQHISDVLGKLPGVEVDKTTGKISYQGKNISKLMVEGLDVSGGQYRQVTDNLKADAVEKAEVLENYQPIRALEGKTFTDEVAINLKLKDDARDVWMFNLDAAAGYEQHATYAGRLNALRFAKGSQDLWSYKTDYTGKNVASELRRLSSEDNGNLHAVSFPELVANSAFSSPIGMNRVRDNRTNLVSVNHLNRSGDYQQSRVMVNYLHDENRMTNGVDETYHYGDQVIQTQERLDRFLVQDHVAAEWDTEQNSTTSYLRNQFQMDGTWDRGNNRLDDVFQHLTNQRLELQNTFHHLAGKQKSILGFRSHVHYSYSPSDLYFQRPDMEAQSQAFSAHQLFTDNQFYTNFNKQQFHIEWYSGVSGNLTFTQLDKGNNYNPHRLQLYSVPSASFSVRKMEAQLQAAVNYYHQPVTHLHQLYLDPMLRMKWEPNTRWAVRVNGSQTHTLSSLTSYYPHLYWKNYRTRYQMNDVVPALTNRSARVETAYRRVIQGFYSSLALSAYDMHYNQTTAMTYLDGVFLYQALNRTTHSSGYAVEGRLSKGSFKLNLNAMLDVAYARSKGESYIQDMKQNYVSSTLTFTPTLRWSPTDYFTLKYDGVFTGAQTELAGSSTLPMLWNMQQTVSLNLGFPSFNATFSADYFRNELAENQFSNLWLGDLDLNWKANKKTRVTFSIHNLFNKKTYQETFYSTVSTTQQWIHLRSRECLLQLSLSL